MRVSELTGKIPVTIESDATLVDAAVLMDRANVGALLVMDGARLAGIVTDRDIVLRAIARRAPLDARIDSVMTTDVVAVEADVDVHDAYHSISRHAVRRLPVVDDGNVVGVVTVDDLLVGLANDLDRLVRPIAGELAFGHHPSPVPAVP
jgi:CBS domain-containing protein